MNNENISVAELGYLSDPDLITRVRVGDTEAYETLFLRHREVALRLARRLTDPTRAEDVVSEAFAKILDLLRRGKGPDVAFRAYLLTTVRTVHLNQIRSGHRESLVADTDLQTLTDPVDDDPEARFDEGAIARAFRQLPERWQFALWMTAVEGRPTEEISQQLGIHNNAVASLAFRARAGLRQAYLAEHLRETASAECARIVDRLPAFLRGTLTPRRRRLVEAHLERCSSCSVAAEELADIDRRLGALLGPVVVGSAGVAAALWPAAASTPQAPVAAGVLAGFTNGAGTSSLGAAVTSLGVGKVAAAAALTAAAIGVSVHTVTSGPTTPPVAEPPRTGTLTLGPSADVSPRPTGTPTGPAAPSDRSGSPGPVPFPEPSVLPPGPVAAGPDPTAGPTSSHSPSHSPSQDPTLSPTPTGTPTAGEAARAIAVAPMSEQTVSHSGRTWHRVSIDVLEPVKDATLRVTSTKTMEAELVTSTTSGWICGTPSFTWLDSHFMASTSTVCIYNGRGDGSPVQIDYRQGDAAPIRSLLTPPDGCQDTSLLDNVAELLLD